MKFVKVIAVLMVATCGFCTSNVQAKKTTGGSHHVNGHFKKDGTHVQPHRSTNPNHTQRDNWSSKPNVNPYNGKQGTKEPDH